MSLRALVANSGLTDDVRHAIFQAEMRSYRDELVHLDAMWKMRPEWATVGDRDADLRVFEGVWSGISEEGLGAPRGAEFVAKHFGERSDEAQARIRSLLRANADLSGAFRRDAEQRLALSAGDIGLSPNTTNKGWHNLSRLHAHLCKRLPDLRPIDVSE